MLMASRVLNIAVRHLEVVQRHEPLEDVREQQQQAFGFRAQLVQSETLVQVALAVGRGEAQSVSYGRAHGAAMRAFELKHVRVLYVSKVSEQPHLVDGLLHTVLESTQRMLWTWKDDLLDSHDTHGLLLLGMGSIAPAGSLAGVDPFVLGSPHHDPKRATAEKCCVLQDKVRLRVLSNGWPQKTGNLMLRIVWRYERDEQFVVLSARHEVLQARAPRLASRLDLGIPMFPSFRGNND